MILDLLTALVDLSSSRRAGWFLGVFLLLALIILPIAACSKGCTKPLTPAQKHQAHVAETLGGQGSVTVEQVFPPVGPWSLVRKGSYHYRAHVAQTGKTIWAEAYVSNWTALSAAAGGDTVYRYRYWGETTLLGKTLYRSIDR